MAKQGDIGPLKELLRQETTEAAYRFMMTGETGWLKASLGEDENKNKVDYALYLVTMKFLPAAHKTGDEPVFPNRYAFTRAIMDAFDVKDNEVRKHINTKNLFAKAPALHLELFGSVAPELLVNAAPENESALPLSSMENLKQPPSLGSNTGCSGGATTLGSEDDFDELQRIRRVLADLGFNDIDEVQHAINENTLIWNVLANYGVEARTAAELEQELNGLERWANLSDTDSSSDHSSENGEIQDGNSVSSSDSNSSNNNEDSA